MIELIPGRLYKRAGSKDVLLLLEEDDHPRWSGVHYKFLDNEGNIKIISELFALKHMVYAKI